jgi:hypothetical protein
MKRRDIGIKQKESKEAYNEYMKAYQRLYYREHQSEWINYMLKRRYRSYTLDRLKALLEKKLKVQVTISDEKRERHINILKEIIKEKENNYDGYTPLKGTYKIQAELEEMNREIHNRGL